MSASPAVLANGTKVQVGRHRVVVERSFATGGFSHVYVVRLPQPVYGSKVAILKRVLVTDKQALSHMRNEVETMKRLRGQKHIVRYIDSHASGLIGGGYEVYLLMEFCTEGSLIDFMNKRLSTRLTEPEILKIFTDICEGVAAMHYLSPALLHRDVKVENVLITMEPNHTFTYKLCDFGSAAPPRRAATTAHEGRLIEEDTKMNTTLQYRCPEMLDVFRRPGVTEKSDIWALGVLLYKLCYYTTPFENHPGATSPLECEQAMCLDIMNASFRFPAYPKYSDRLKLLIANLLREEPLERPNIYLVIREACRMQGREVPLHDIYTRRPRPHSTPAHAHQDSESPLLDLSPEPRLVQNSFRSSQSPSPSPAGIRLNAFSPTIQETPIIPDIAPMRRGRPETIHN